MLSQYTTHNGNDDAALIFVRSMNVCNGMGVVLDHDEQCVRFCFAACAFEFEDVINWYLAQYEFVMRYFSIQTHYIQWLVCSLVECMERVSCWSWAIRLYVCIVARALELEGVIGVQ